MGLYFAHNIGYANNFTNRLLGKKEDVKELGDIFSKLYESHVTIGTDSQIDYTEILKRLQGIKSTLGIDSSDRFLFGEKLGIKRETMITIFLRSGLESMTGYSFKEQKFYSERFPGRNDLPRVIPSDDASTRQMIKDAFNPDLPFDTTVSIIKELIAIAEEMIKSNPTRRYSREQDLSETNFMLSLIGKIMSR